MKARQAVRKAIRNQVENRGFSLVEVLSSCPTGWKMKPILSYRWIEEVMMPVFPLGVFRDVSAEREGYSETRSGSPPAAIPQLLEIDLEDRSNLPLSPRSAAELELRGIKIAGFGGQGVLYLGVLMATAGMMEGLRTSWLPSYGPEMRGGTANCNVVLSRKEIGTPLVEHPDVLIALNGPSLDRFQHLVKEGGDIVYDSSLISPEGQSIRPGAVGIPLSKLAHELGEPRVANLIALGALMAKNPFLEVEVIHRAIADTIEKENLREVNRKALALGMSCAREAIAGR
jgi:2-oxoisovalerate ferredoxin oxidoreductase beta subunit